jgi:hypothetical protein
MSGRPWRLRILATVRWVCAAIVVAAGLSACSMPSTRNGDPAKVQQQAQADLARWDQTVAAAGGDSAFVAVGMSTLMVGYDWGPDPEVGYNDKVALMAGDFEAVVSLPSDTPPDGQVRWQDGSTRTVGLISAQQALSEMVAEGSGSCGGCVPLKVTGAQLTTGEFQTDHGQAAAPAWEFTLQGTDVKIAHLAVAHPLRIVPATFDPNGPPVPQLISIESATVTADGFTLTVTFEGAPKDAGGSCGAEYTAQAVESSTAVVVIVTEHPGFGLSLGCTAAGAWRTADATLSAPLGIRAVLEVTQGMPVSVTLTP